MSFVHGVWECPDCGRQAEVHAEGTERLIVLMGCVPCDRDFVEVS